jgi:predicted NACHT family NTPase
MEKVSALTWTALVRIATDVWQSAQSPYVKPKERIERGEPSPGDVRNALDVYRDLVLKNCDIAGISDLIGPQRFSAPRPAQRRLYIPREIKLLWDILPGTLAPPMYGIKAPHDEEENIDETAFEKWETSTIGRRIDLARRLVVWGEAGSGKTSLIQWLATGLTLRERQDKEFDEFPGAEMLPEGEYVPMVARACDLNRDDPEAWIEGVTHTALDDEKKSVAFNDALMAGFIELLEDGRALILIDGADELVSYINAEQFFKALIAITRRFPKARILITSDYSAWRGIEGAMQLSFEHVTQADITGEQKSNFAQNWCEIAVGEKRRADRVDELKKAVDASESIRILTKNPMLLTMLAMVVAGPGGSPKSRIELYDESLRTLVYSPNIDSGVVDRSESFPQLQYLAFEMWRRDTHCLPEGDIIEMLEGFWRESPELRPIRDRTAEEFFRLAKRRTGILVEEKKVGEKDGGRLYGFRHRIYRDYLAGCALYEGFYEGCERSKSVSERVGEMTRKIRVFEGTGSDWEYEAAGRWIDVLRACVAICRDDEVDEVLRAISESGIQLKWKPETLWPDNPFAGAQ